MIGLVQQNPDIDEPGPDDFLPIGVEIAVGRLLSLSDGNSSALVQGRRRVEIVEFIQDEPYFRVRARPIIEPVDVDREVDALMRTTRDLFEKCVQLDRSLPDEAHLFSINIPEPGWLADMIATAISLPFKERQTLLLLPDPRERLKRLNWLLAQELDVLQLEDEIQNKVQNEVDRSQREFYLREQMKAIQTELGEGDIWMRDIAELKEKIEKTFLPEEARKVALKEIDRLTQMPSMAPEVGIIRTYLDWILELPWDKTTEDNLDVKHAAKVLEQNHFGLKDAKDRILEYIAVRSLKPKKLRQPILCFAGRPERAKPPWAARSPKRWDAISCAFRWAGCAMRPKSAGTAARISARCPAASCRPCAGPVSVNPLFMLDEIDKLGADFRGDPSAALLEVLDPEQNYSFSDHYLEIAYDLSKVMFITTANSLGSIPPALLDRMEVIEFPGYIEEEKLEIARRFLIPRQMEESGLEEERDRIPRPGRAPDHPRIYLRSRRAQPGARNWAHVPQSGADEIGEEDLPAPTGPGHGGKIPGTAAVLPDRSGAPG